MSVFASWAPDLSDMPFLCRLTQELASMGIGVRYELG